MQKWPNEITAIRHIKSAYNDLNRTEIPRYAEFSAMFDKEFAAIDVAKVMSGQFPSAALKKLAIEIAPALQAQTSDYDTDVAEGAMQTAIATGQILNSLIEIPDTIYVSPYKRTRKTLQGLIEGWPELGDVKQFEDDRIREQEHGLRTAYSDWRLYFIDNPKYALKSKLETGYEYKYEGGESFIDVKVRLRHFVSMLIREHGGITPDGSERKPENIMMVTHHLAIMALRANLERWSRKKFLAENETNRPPNCSATVYRGKENGEGGSPQSKHGRIELAKKYQVLYN